MAGDRLRHKLSRLSDTMNTPHCNTKKWKIVFLLSSIVFLAIGPMVSILKEVDNGKSKTVSFISSGSDFSPPHQKHSPIARALSDKTIRRLAIVRPFGKEDVQSISDSFDLWSMFPPCDESQKQRENETFITVVDVILSFSKSYTNSPGVKHTVENVINKFFSGDFTWSNCFGVINAIEASIQPEQDIYLPSLVDEDNIWVNGPIRQFESIFRTVKKYDVFFLMDADSVPRKSFWLDSLIAEAEEKAPFAILGSKYDGDKWNPILNQIPLPLLHHIYGNAIYNVSHPFLRLITNQQELDATSKLSSLAFGDQIPQTILEGAQGIRPDVNLKLVSNNEEENTNKEQFMEWWKKYERDEPIKESNIISNHAATNILPKHFNDAFIATLHSPWDPSMHDITLVVTEWYDKLSQHLLSKLDLSKHPFSKVTLMIPNDAMTYPQVMTSLPVEIHKRPAPDYMDLCAVPISTEWFMMTNSYHTVAKHIDLLFTLDSKRKPIIPVIPANEEHCFRHDGCKQTLVLAKEISPDINMIVQDFDMLFHTSDRNQFCDMWTANFGKKGENLYTLKDGMYHPIEKSRASPSGPTATSYVAYLMSKGVAEDIYSFSDRAYFGARQHFIKVFAAEEANNYHRKIDWV